MILVRFNLKLNTYKLLIQNVEWKVKLLKINDFAECKKWVTYYHFELVNLYEEIKIYCWS